MDIFAQISVLLALTAAVTLVVRLLKQPLVVGYILAGIIAGPSVLNILQSRSELEVFSRAGIVFLLFIVGLHLNPKVIKEVGSVSLLTGIGQVVFTSAIGFVLAVALGVDRLAALYVAIALTFSSTIIILKLLADKRDLHKLYAKIAIGFLLVQDIVATLILIGIAAFVGRGSGDVASVLGLTLLKGAALLVGLYVVSAFLLPKLTRFLASSQELLFLFSLAWGTGLASLFAALGFSIEVGALLAGVTMAATPYAEETASRLKPLRDFFIVIFFVLLGSQLTFGSLGHVWLPALALSVFVLVGNPIIVIILMNVLGYSRRTGFLAGLTVAQISEFSLILAALGLRVGHITPEILSLVTLVGLITIAGSTYLILYSEKIYPLVSRLLVFLELVKRSPREKGAVGERYEAVIFGYDRVGKHFARALSEVRLPFVVVDFNPHSIDRLQQEKLPYRYGDAGDVEFLNDLPLVKPKLAVSTVPELITNLVVTRFILSVNPKAVVVTIAQTVAEARQLYEAGAAYVMMPHYLGAEYAAKLISKYGTDHAAYRLKRDQHLKTLEKQS